MELRALQIDVATGEKYYQAVAFKDGKMVPGDWKRCAAGCRMHSCAVMLHTLVDCGAMAGLTRGTQPCCMA